MTSKLPMVGTRLATRDHRNSRLVGVQAEIGQGSDERLAISQ
jgi:hypothetical protein